MKKGTKQLMLTIGGGAFFWWLIQKGKLPRTPETLHATRPTDSMLPGTLGPAVQGIVKEGEGLSCIGCVR